jgi:hypothetical protein
MASRLFVLRRSYSVWLVQNVWVKSITDKALAKKKLSKALSVFARNAAKPLE